MKKSTTFVAMALFLSAAVGALTAAWLYIRRREKELDEYEQLLFSEDLDEDELEEEPVEEVVEEEPVEEAAPAEETETETAE